MVQHDVARITPREDLLIVLYGITADQMRDVERHRVDVLHLLRINKKAIADRTARDDASFAIEDVAATGVFGGVARSLSCRDGKFRRWVHLQLHNTAEKCCEQHEKADREER